MSDEKSYLKRLKELAKTQPEAMPILAARAALRVFPMLANKRGHFAAGKHDKNSAKHLISVYTALLSVYCHEGSKTNNILTRNAASAASTNAAAAASAAAFAASASDYPDATDDANAGYSAYVAEQDATYADTANVAARIAAARVAATAGDAVFNAAEAEIAQLEQNALYYKDLQLQPLWKNSVTPEKLEPYYERFPSAVEALIQDEKKRGSNKRIIDALEAIIPFWKRCLNGIGPKPHIGGPKIKPQHMSDTDYLGRTNIIDGLAEQIRHKKNEGKQTIGLFGHWGIGKSNAIHLLKQKLSEDDDILFGEFNAWDYEHTESFHAGITQEMLDALLHVKHTRLSFLRAKLQRWWLTTRFGWNIRKAYTPLLLILSILALGFVYISSRFEILNYIWGFLGFIGVIELIAFLNFSKTLKLGDKTRIFFSAFKTPSYTHYLGTVADMKKDIAAMCKIRLGKDKKLLFIIDDLDRCGHENIVTVLEAVKIALDIDRVFVLLAVDERIMLSALALHYKDIAEYHSHKDPHIIARDYLAKIILQPIRLEQPDISSLHSYLSHLWDETNKPEWYEPLAQYHKFEDHPKAALPLEDIPEPPKSETESTDNSSSPKEEADKVDINQVLDILDALPPLDKDDTDTEITDVYDLPAELKAAFAFWMEIFNITNPRQVKRVYNSYEHILLSRIGDNASDERVVLNSPYYFKLSVLCALEYIHSLSDNNYAIKQAFLEGNLTPKIMAKTNEHEFLKRISNLFTGDKERQKTAQAIEAFVLPMIELDRILFLY